MRQLVYLRLHVSKPLYPNIAEKAYKQALFTLSSIPSFISSQTTTFLDAQPNSLLSQLFPNQQGPIASTIRIIYKLRQQTWLPSPVRTILGLSKDGANGGGRKKEEELKGKAVKVVDLLEHAVELGHSDALYKLAQVSLVRCSSQLRGYGV